MQRSERSAAADSTSLGLGSGMALWAFRVCAVRHQSGLGAGGRCPTGTALASDGERVEALLLTLVDGLVRHGQRDVWISMPGSTAVTQDELSLLAALAAGGDGDAERARAHLAWLLIAPPQQALVDAAIRVGATFASYGYRLDPPRAAAPDGVSRPAAAAPSSASPTAAGSPWETPAAPRRTPRKGIMSPAALQIGTIAAPARH